MTWYKVTRFACNPLNVSIVTGRGEPRPKARIAELQADGYRFHGASGMFGNVVYDFTYDGPGVRINAESPEEAWEIYDELEGEAYERGGMEEVARLIDAA